MACLDEDKKAGPGETHLYTPQNVISRNGCDNEGEDEVSVGVGGGRGGGGHRWSERKYGRRESPTLCVMAGRGSEWRFSFAQGASWGVTRTFRTSQHPTHQFTFLRRTKAPIRPTDEV